MHQGKQDVKRERMGSEGWFCDDLVRTGLTPSVKEARESYENNERQGVQCVGPGAGAQQLAQLKDGGAWESVWLCEEGWVRWGSLAGLSGRLAWGQVRKEQRGQ